MNVSVNSVPRNIRMEEEEWDSKEEELKRANEEVDIKLNKVKQNTGIDFDSITRSIQDSRFSQSSQKSIDSTLRNDVSQDLDFDDLNVCEDSYKTGNDRIQEAQIKSLTNQLRNMVKLKQEAERSVKDLKSKLKTYEDGNDRMKSKLAQMKSSSGKQKILQAELEDLRVENQTLKKEVSSLQSLIKTAETKGQAREVRLKRALQSVEKYKQLLLQRKVEKNESTNTNRKEMADMEKKMKDLLHGFKKQMQLIDVLKRQKIHVEASRMLDFTEQEFTNVLDWGT